MAEGATVAEVDTMAEASVMVDTAAAPAVTATADDKAIDVSDSDTDVEEIAAMESQSSPLPPPQPCHRGSVGEGHGGTCAGPRWTTEEVQRAAEFRLSRLPLQATAMAKFARWALSPPARGFPSAVAAALQGHLRCVQGSRLLAAWHVLHKLVSSRGPYCKVLEPELPQLVQEHMPHGGSVQVQEQYLKMLLAWEEGCAAGRLFGPETWQLLEPCAAFRFVRWEPQLVYYAHPEKWLEELQCAVNFAARWSRHRGELVRGVVEGLEGAGAEAKLPYWAALDIFCDHATLFEEAIAPRLPALLRFHGVQADPRFRTMLRSWAEHGRFPAAQDPITHSTSSDSAGAPTDLLEVTHKWLEVREYTQRQMLLVHSRELRQQEENSRAGIEVREVEDWQYIRNRQAAAAKWLKVQQREALYWEKVAAKRPVPGASSTHAAPPPKCLRGDPAGDGSA
eukprot:GGOE01000448.1.p1 GENE.GGOE01000448.1~~GGOE01000448.1.p1  ORF type:complete len:451 (-),score=88.43 GGOE01000448.1:329-1681(-)